MSDNSKGDKPAKRNVFGHSQSPAEKPRHFRQTMLRLADYLLSLDHKSRRQQA